MFAMISCVPHACMYAMCIGILLRFVMLVRTCTINIYVRHDIMWTFPFSAAFDVVLMQPDQVKSRRYVYEPTWWVHVRLRGLYEEKYTHSTLPGT